MSPLPGILASQMQGHLNNNSFESIATYAGGTGTITFNSIPSTYKHLQIRMSATASSVDDVYIRFNNDTTSTYFANQMRGGGTATPQAFAYTNQTYMFITSNIGQSSTAYNIAICDILEYTNANKIKTIRSSTGYDTNSGGEAIMWSGGWNNSSATVSRIDIFLNGGTFGSSSIFALYGIKG